MRKEERWGWARAGALAVALYAVAVWRAREELAVAAEYDGRWQRAAASEEQRAVRDAMRHAWHAYAAHAWGKDNLMPLSKTPGTPVFDLAATLLDGVDTLFLMDLEVEYVAARAWIAHDLALDPPRFVNTFETVIRCLGGLLGAYTLSRDKIFLEKATELGYRLLPAFEKSPTGIPFRDVNLRTGAVRVDDVPLSEATTVQLELRALAQLSGEPRFAAAADRAMCAVERLVPRSGLVESRLNATNGALLRDKVTFGARGDSYYEYLLKQWLLTRQEDGRFWALYDDAIRGLCSSGMLQRTQDGELFVAEIVSGQLSPKMDHLVCFLPGTLLLGAFYQRSFETSAAQATNEAIHPRSLEVDYSHEEFHTLALELLETCVRMYERTATGLAPEIVWFNVVAPRGRGMQIRAQDAHSLKRPETLESLYLLCRLLPERCAYSRSKAWRIFSAFQRYARVDSGGYASIQNVQQLPPVHLDNQETFFVAETLKYLYLLFSADAGFLSPADAALVLNTEAHFLSSFRPASQPAGSAPPPAVPRYACRAS